MQKHVNLVDLVKSFPTNIYLQKLASVQKRTSPVRFAHLAEKSGKGSISNLSTKRVTAAASARTTSPDHPAELVPGSGPGEGTLTAGSSAGAQEKARTEATDG